MGFPLYKHDDVQQLCQFTRGSPLDQGSPRVPEGPQGSPRVPYAFTHGEGAFNGAQLPALQLLRQGQGCHLHLRRNTWQNPWVLRLGTSNDLPRRWYLGQNESWVALRQTNMAMESESFADD